MSVPLALNILLQPMLSVAYVFCHPLPVQLSCSSCLRVYLITKGKIGEAEKALSWFRGGVDVKDELAEMQRGYQDQQKIGSVSFVKLVADKVYLQPFLLMLALMFFQQFSGINAVNFNMVSIFQDVGSDMDEGLQAFIINIAQVKPSHPY